MKINTNKKQETSLHWRNKNEKLQYNFFWPEMHRNITYIHCTEAGSIKIACWNMFEYTEKKKWKQKQNQSQNQKRTKANCFQIKCNSTKLEIRTHFAKKLLSCWCFFFLYSKGKSWTISGKNLSHVFACLACHQDRSVAGKFHRKASQYYFKY